MGVHGTFVIGQYHWLVNSIINPYENNNSVIKQFVKDIPRSPTLHCKKARFRNLYFSIKDISIYISIKIQTSTSQTFTFQAVLPQILLSNSQNKNLLKRTLKFQKEDNLSHWSRYADPEAAVRNVLQNRCS